MGRNMSPMLRRELANLDKDADSRKSAMKALKSYVKDLDSKAIPLFLAQVSETKEPGLTGEYTISLYEVLARVHGRNIVPQIDNIMSTIIKTLTSSAGSFPLQQACSKVVPAIARYGIDPAITSEIEKSKIIYSLCKPLSDALMSSPESLASGAALCLRALVESDNWRFASDDVVNEVCLRVAGALEENLTQTNSHMGLAMSLAKHNGLIIEAYARSLIRSGIRILTGGPAEVNSQKRFSAVQMINFLMKCIDSGSISSELAAISVAMEKCHSDRMPFVRGAAFEALQTARAIAAEKGSKYEKDSSLTTGSNLSRRRTIWGIRDNSNTGSCSSLSPRYASPESQTVNSFVEYDSFPESPLSIGQSSCNFECGRSVNRKLWRNENGGVDVSLKDGLYSDAKIDDNYSKKYFDHFGDDEQSDMGRDRAEAFLGFAGASPTSVVMRSATPSPQRPQSQLAIDDIKIFTTPRKLIHSLQDPNDVNSEFSENKGRGFGSSNGSEVEWTPARRMNANGLHHNLNYEVESKKNSDTASMMSWHNDVEDDELELDGSESVSSTSDVPAEAEHEVSCEAGGQVKDKVQSASITRKSFGKTALSLVCGLSLILPAVILSAMWIENQEESFNFVPT